MEESYQSGNNTPEVVLTRPISYSWLQPIVHPAGYIGLCFITLDYLPSSGPTILEV